MQLYTVRADRIVGYHNDRQPAKVGAGEITIDKCLMLEMSLHVCMEGGYFTLYMIVPICIGNRRNPRLGSL